MGQITSNLREQQLQDYSLVEDEGYRRKLYNDMVNHFIKTIDTKFAKEIDKKYRGGEKYIEYRYTCSKSNSYFRSDVGTAVGKIANYLSEKYPNFYFRVTMDCMLSHTSRIYTLGITPFPEFI